MASKRILVVEDEQDLVEALQENLSRKGHIVETATSAESALELMKKGLPDVILLDLIFPGMSGIDFLAAINDIRAQKNIPVIVFTNVDNPEDAKKAKEYNISDYLVKTDWRLEDIVAKVERLV